MYHNKSFIGAVDERAGHLKRLVSYSVELLSLAIGVIKTAALKDNG